MSIFYNEEFLGHILTPFHPESPERLRGIVLKLKETNLWKDVFSSKVGKREHLLLAHDEDYIDFIRNCGECFLTVDTVVHNETYDIAALSAECGIDASEFAKSHGKTTFALTRPPGHHAGRDYGMGFCFFNNIAIAAKYLQSQGDRRIAIVDLDVHHGNGTQDIFATDPTVLYISTHQLEVFPGTGRANYVGEGDGEGYTLNMPFSSGCGDSTYDVAMTDLIKPVVTEFDPSAILVSFGVDTHYKEPLASLSLSSDGHVRQAAELIKLSGKCNGRVTFFLEGGYYVPALAEVVAAMVGLSRGVDVPCEFNDVMDNSCLGRDTIAKCKRIASNYWKL